MGEMGEMGEMGGMETDSYQYQTIRDHRELGIYQKAFGGAMEIFHLSKKFPPVKNLGI